MSEPRHTLGPWRAVSPPDGQSIAIVGPEAGERIAIMTRDNTSVGQSNEVYANARLIAGAPGLLAACVGMAERLEEYVEELRRDGFVAEAGNIDRIAASLRAAASKAL